MKLILPLVTFLAFMTQLRADEAQPSLFARKYALGETLQYIMTGTNRDDLGIKKYSITVDTKVQKDSAEIFYETAKFSNFEYNGLFTPLDSISEQFRQDISLDPQFKAENHQPVQDGIDSRLRPISDDLMNIYVDLWFASKLGTLRKRGDHFYFKYGVPVTYLSGNAQTCVDFDFTLRDVDEKIGIAILEVSHVPPEKACVSLPAPWMQVPVSNNRPNNVVQIIRGKDGMYTVTVGSEIIEVIIKVDLKSGKILAASLDDRFHLVDRVCADARGNNCYPGRSYEQRREIMLKAQ